MAVDITQMRKGLLEFCVLAQLEGEPRYGYELVQRLGEVDGMLTSEGTIYPLLARLHREGLVAVERRPTRSSLRYVTGSANRPILRVKLAPPQSWRSRPQHPTSGAGSR